MAHREIDAASGERITYADLEETCERIAAGFQDLGLQPGDTMAFISANSMDLVMAFIAAIFAGVKIACAKTTFNEREIEPVLNMTKPSVVFCDIFSAQKVRQACQGVTSVKVLVTTGDCDGMVNFAKLKDTPQSRFERAQNTSPGDIFTVFQSSGSTGLPKGVLITHRNFVAQLVTFGYKNAGVRNSKVFLLYLPVMHAGPFWLLFTMLTHHVELVLLAASDLASVLLPIAKYKVNNVVLYPTHGHHIAQRGLPPSLDISSMRYVFIAGSSIPPQVMRALANLFKDCKIVHGYGLTEGCCGVAYTRDTCYDFKTSGTPMPYVHIKVIDVDTGEKLNPGQYGEICIKGPACFQGYLGMPVATAAAFDNEGFVKTGKHLISGLSLPFRGDTGYYTARGELYVLDRIKDLIKCKDLQVAPTELEELLQEHPDVAQSAVTGVPHPEYGEAPRAFLVLNEEAGLADEGSLKKKRQEITEYIKGLVADHKQLHGGVEFVDAIPQTETGKPHRRNLRDAYVLRNASFAVNGKPQ
ncbi:hypothetical protein HPB48_011243 [Haemaphysalis longicornis]|uniref:Acyl-coa synthetase n=1 Tax=Haemaphysalis longicornis TaxID=44386 RepID=A0A9J6FMX9_HAELO|nr:hypothetical protein HPB48_011243 [Haemaphysalis longicornis]